MLCCLFLGGIVSYGITEISGESAVHVVLLFSRWYSIPRYHRDIWRECSTCCVVYF